MAGSPVETRHRHDQRNITFTSEKKKEIKESVIFLPVGGICGEGGRGDRVRRCHLTTSPGALKSATLAADASPSGNSPVSEIQFGAASLLLPVLIFSYVCLTLFSQSLNLPLRLLKNIKKKKSRCVTAFSCSKMHHDTYSSAGWLSGYWQSQPVSLMFLSAFFTVRN